MLEIWLSLGQIKKKLSPTWTQEEKESNPAWRKKETGQDTTRIQRKMIQKNFSTMWRKSKKEKKCTSRTRT